MDKNISDSLDSNQFQKSRREIPPRPPSGSPPFPTIDASPLMIPNIWIKRTSKASHSIAGPDATKRLFTAQHKICSWIWNQIERRGSMAVESPSLGSNPYQCDVDDRKDNNSNNRSMQLRQMENSRIKGGSGSCSVGFMLVGHGVPYQLLQDHVDCAWKMLNDVSLSSRKTSAGKVAMADDAEIVECNFFNDTKELQFEGIKVRSRDNVILHHPQSKSFYPFLESFNSDQELYLTVMNRISTTFGTILQTQPPPVPSSIINTDKYWKRDILNPMSCWRATFRRGFVYPPSATSTSFDSFIMNTHDGKVKEGREFWTGPPIVELIPSCGPFVLGSHEETNNIDDMDGTIAQDRDEGRSIVKVTIQGIPSVFWQEQDSDSGSRNMGKDDMIPLSLVFEACFHNPTKASTTTTR